MNDTTNSPALSGGTAIPPATDSANPSREQSCCQKMMSACKDMCNRFLDSRISVAYNITTQTHKPHETGTDKGGKSASGKTPACAMTKQGTLELRPMDMAIGAMLICVISSMCVAIKSMCKCK